jgi:hypothetical protein
MLNALVVVALCLCGLCALLSWVFVARHARTAWQASHGGRYLMRSKIALALLFTFTLLGQIIPIRPLTGVVLSILLFAWTAYVLVDLLSMQAQEIRRAKAERERLS